MPEQEATELRSLVDRLAQAVNSGASVDAAKVRQLRQAVSLLESRSEGRDAGAAAADDLDDLVVQEATPHRSG